MAQDTIAAISTPPGEGAIGVVRLSGPESLAIAARWLRAAKPPAAWVPRRLYRSFAGAPRGAVIDDGLACCYRGPHSYTGEDGVEFFGHGGRAVLAQVLALAVHCGARPAEPGEFTKRAFLNGRIDLTQAEAVARLIAADSEAAARRARQALDGTLGRSIRELRNSLLETLAEIEAGIDFPEEDLPPVKVDAWRDAIARAAQAMATLVQSYARGQLEQFGAGAVIAGPPNAGKSRLLNLLCGFDRAIVASQPGTTRDPVAAAISVDGVKLTVTDTAGLRATADEVETEGVKRAERLLADTPIVIWVADVTVQPAEDTLRRFAALTAPTVILVLTKTDLPEPHLSAQPFLERGRADAVVRASGLTGAGHTDLRRALSEALARGSGGVDAELVIVEERHLHALTRAGNALDAGLAALSRGADLYPELLAEDLREAVNALGEISGENVGDEVLHRIFSRFCIGK